MDKTIKVILLMNNQILISQIEEMSTELGEPDCRLVNPCEFVEEQNLSRWMSDNTNQTEFMISSDKIITIADPNKDLLDKYLKKIN